VTTGRHRAALLDLGLAATLVAIELSDMFAFDRGGRRDPLDVCLLVGSAAVLVIRRRFPFVCLQLAGAATITLAARHAPHIGLGAIAATYAVALYASPRARHVAVPLLLVAVWLVPLLTSDVASIPRNAALFGAAWLLGQLIRERREQHDRLLDQTLALAREREQKLALAAEAERSRLIREVHDVLSHSVSVMVVQAQGAQALEDDPARVRLALSRIEQTGQGALTELRGLLRDQPSGEAPRVPQPGIARIKELAQATREAGVAVELSVETHDRAIPATIELSAYRIVQEALTNVLRHSGARAARVAVRCRGQELEVEIVDDGRRAPSATGDGRGISGMRERAHASGGSLEAHSVELGGFRVIARLPVPG
jgi:signal transduction histidine kinase